MKLTVQPEAQPNFLLLILPGFAILALAAFFAYKHWDQIPARFPIHWGSDGIPNGWSVKTVKGVFGLLILGTELHAWPSAMAIANWYGARRSQMRTTCLKVTFATQYVLIVSFSAISLMVTKVLPLRSWVIFPFMIAPIIGILIYVARHAADPSDAPSRPYTGILYFNPDEAALAVEKSAGIGYTLNFANPWSWPLAAGLLIVLASGVWIFF